MSNTVTAYRYKNYNNIKEIFIPSLQLILQENGFIYNSERPNVTKKVYKVTDTYFEGCCKGHMNSNRKDLKILLDLATKKSMKKIQIPLDTANAVSGWQRQTEEIIKDLALLLFLIPQNSDII